MGASSKAQLNGIMGGNEKKQSKQNASIMSSQYTVTPHLMIFDHLIIPNEGTTTVTLTRKVN